MAVTKAGTRLVAAGVRGAILLSDDQGKTWRQVPVPVSSDLVALQFISPKTGWAVGHDNVILRTNDGGATWSKQLDGRMLQAQLQEHFRKQADSGNAEAKRYLEDVKMNYQFGPEQSFLGVWFEDESNGFAVGTFGTLVATRDGGKTWQSWMEKADNEERLHFYSIRGIAGNVFITSERGRILKFDRAAQKFTATSVNYEGGLFGVAGTKDYLLAYGLRGVAYRSPDGGSSWQQVTTGVNASLNNGVILDDGRIALVTQDGRIVISADGGATFRSMPAAYPTLLSDLVQSGKALIITGWNGVQELALK
jgi:photosystem II stability/assembly factor-like uncharacterized protein